MPTLDELLEKMIAAGKPLERLLSHKAPCPNHCFLSRTPDPERGSCDACKTALARATADYAAAEAAFWERVHANRPERRCA